MTEKKPLQPEAEYFYISKFSQKQYRFSPKQDELVATFNSQLSQEILDSTSRAVSLPVEGRDLKRRFAVFHVPPENTLESASQRLTAETDIINSIPAMLDSEGLTRYFLPDECTVQFQPDISHEEAERLIEQVGSSIVRKQRTPGYYTVTIPEGKGLFETIRQFSELDQVTFAEPSEFGLNDALAYVPDDPSFERLWGLRNTGQTVNGTTGTSGADIKASQAWEITRGNPNVIIAVIDTGADLDHPDIAANILSRGTEDWDFSDNNDDIPEDQDLVFHGTHVSGTVGAVDNTLGIIGVAPECQLMPLRINLSSGMNQNRADAINYVASQARENPNRRYVINCSWRMNGDHDGVHNAIINAINNNVVVVFAAGNANQNMDITPQYPAVYPEVIAVAATDQDDVKAGFSNFGTDVDVSAPGVNIFSTIGGGNYGFLNGTSMASPHVAGLAALIWSINPALSNQYVRNTIEQTCDDIDSVNPSFAGQLGRGRINAFTALSLIIS